jgi:hypothetical protein
LRKRLQDAPTEINIDTRMEELKKEIQQEEQKMVEMKVAIRSSLLFAFFVGETSDINNLISFLDSFAESDPEYAEQV